MKSMVYDKHELCPNEDIRKKDNILPLAANTYRLNYSLGYQ